jgi:hypothetical protein
MPFNLPVKNITLYLFVIVWIIMLIFSGDMYQHPIWGVLPFVFSIICIPSFAVFLLVEMIKNVIGVFVEEEKTKINRFLTARIVIPLILLMACFAYIYYNFSK